MYKRFAIFGLSFLVFGCSAGKEAIPTKGEALVATPPNSETIKHVRENLGWDDVEAYTAGLELLKRLGNEQVFPAFEAILAVPTSSDEVRDILGVLCDLKGDRSRFVEPAVQALAHPHSTARRNAARLLGEIGSSKEASPIVALLSDDRDSCVSAAAKALAAIGGPREVVAMDVWLLGSSQGAKDKVLRAHVKKCRDELEQRLAKEKKEKEKR